MTRRFDRTPAGDKVHMQTLGAMAHFDFNAPRSNSYEQAFDVLRLLGLGSDSAEELFRRMAFNVVARNIPNIENCAAQLEGVRLRFLRMGGQHDDAQIIDMVMASCFDGLGAR